MRAVDPGLDLDKPGQRFGVAERFGVAFASRPVLFEEDPLRPSRWLVQQLAIPGQMVELEGTAIA